MSTNGRNAVLTLNGDIRVSCLMDSRTVEHLRETFPRMKTNLMAFWDGYLYLALGNRITAHKLPLFSSKNVPTAAEIISESPEFTLKPSPAQVSSFAAKMGLTGDTQVRKEINHIRAGLLDGQPVLVAVGEFGMIFAWDLGKLPALTSEVPADRVFYAPNPTSTWGIAFNAQSSLLFVSSNAHAISVFDYYSGECLFSDHLQPVHTHNIPSLDSKGNWLISAGIDQSCVLWDFRDPRQPKWHRRVVKVDAWGWLARFVDVESTVDGRIRIERSSFDVDEEFHDNQVDEIGPIGSYFLSNGNDDDMDSVGDDDEEMDYSADSFDEGEIYFSDALPDAEEFDRTGATFVEGAERSWSTGSSNVDDLSMEGFQEEFDTDYEELMEEIFPDRNPNELSFNEILNSLSNSSHSSHYMSEDCSEESELEEAEAAAEEEIDFIYNCVVCDEQVHALKIKIEANQFLKCADSTIEDSSWPPHILLSSHFLTLFQTNHPTLIKPFHYLTQYCEAPHFKSYWLSMLERPSMGVWCDALRLLVFCEQSGALYIAQLGCLNAVALRVPEREPKYEIIGLSIRVVHDSEFGAKAQVFCLDYSGKLSVYEILRIGT